MAPSAAAHNASRRYTTLGAGALFAGPLFAGALTYTAIADPHNRDALFPPCPFKLLTGWNCPACGGLRMTHDLLHGDLAQAVVDNLYLLIGIPAVLAWILYRRQTGRPAATKTLFVVVIASAVAWTVARNLPGFPLVPTLSGG